MPDYIGEMIQEAYLKDMDMQARCPAWYNSRKGEEYISKHIDLFLVNEHLHQQMGSVKTWVEGLLSSNHRPIAMKWKFENKWKGYPFKFNRTFLVDADFKKMVI